MIECDYMKTNELGKYLNINVESEIEITGITTSTKRTYPGCVLILIRGKNVNPNELLTPTIISNCSLILSDDEMTDYIYIKDLKDKVFDILDYFYFNKIHPFKIIGITGTEGKSSLADIIYQGLTSLKRKCLLLSNEQRHNDTYYTSLTTPSPEEIINAFKLCKRMNYQYLIMEVSCIGLSQKRIDSKIFDYLFLTNLHSDHLDYYDNLYHYHLSKINFFLENIKGKKFILKSAYDKYPHLFQKATNLTIVDEADIKLKNMNLKHQVFKYKNEDYYCHLLFKQNRINIVFLIEFLKNLNYRNLFTLIKKIHSVKGRLDVINFRPYIIIDYAHSPSSVENVLSQLSLLKQNRIIAVIGAGGDRDKTKRSLYGKSCLKYAEMTIVCNDNPRSESPMEIARAITNDDKEHFKIILNRKDAIKYAINQANIDDIVVIMGRGNEEYQYIGSQKIHLNDYEVAKKCLSNHL